MPRRSLSDTRTETTPRVHQMRKLVIQIACFNEAETLPQTLRELPRRVSGFDRVEWLVVDDGSDDGTAEVARRHGADRVVRLSRHAGLARAFNRAIAESLAMDATAIVHTDADNQYQASCIPAILAPLLKGEADIVVGARPFAEAGFSLLKQWLQRLGSATTRALSGTSVADATCGFRAYTRRAAITLHAYGNYTYTIETLIQAGLARLMVASMPIRVNPPTRPSRLIRSTAQYLIHAIRSMARATLLHAPLRLFLPPAVALAGAGLSLAAWRDRSNSLSLSAPLDATLALSGLLMLLGFLLAIAGCLAYSLTASRRLFTTHQLQLDENDRAGSPGDEESSRPPQEAEYDTAA